MIAEDVIKFMEDWAPTGAAWEKDNVGLQVGSLKQRVSNIFLCLELTPKSLDEALKKKADFIFTHHPFIFKPLKKVNTDSDPKGILIKKLIENNITLYSAHTNLDFTKDGVSFELAKNLRLENPEFLVNQKSNQYKLVVFVPQNHLDNLSKALFKSGAGIIGEYDSCSFQNEGIGTFKGSEFSNPAVGKKENFEKADEIRLELLVDSWKLNNVIKALKKTHPYEEPAFDIYPLNNENQNYGYGVLGYLKKSMSQNEFLSHLCKSLKTNNLRYSIGKSGKIKSVAVCGGSGSDLLASAIKRKADAFVTADLKYHTFQDGEGQILFVDAGHYETEIHVLNIVKKKLEKFVKEKGEKIGIIKYSRSTNPIKFFNNKGVK